MSKEIADIIRKIQSKTDNTIEDIADGIGLSRPYLNKAKLAPDTDKEKYEAVLDKLKDRFADILQNDTSVSLQEHVLLLKENLEFVKKEVRDRLNSIDASLKILIGDTSSKSLQNHKADNLENVSTPPDLVAQRLREAKDKQTKEAKAAMKRKRENLQQGSGD